MWGEMLQSPILDQACDFQMRLYWLVDLAQVVWTLFYKNLQLTNTKKNYHHYLVQYRTSAKTEVNVTIQLKEL